MPEEVSVAIDALGNRARLEVLRILSRHGQLTLTEVAEALGIDRSSARRHLVTLEELGFVQGDVPHDERWRRTTVRWQADAHAVDQAFSALRDYAAGR